MTARHQAIEATPVLSATDVAGPDQRMVYRLAILKCGSLHLIAHRGRQQITWKSTQPPA
jgi:hypothetical protein